MVWCEQWMPSGEACEAGHSRPLCDSYTSFSRHVTCFAPLFRKVPDQNHHIPFWNHTYNSASATHKISRRLIN